MFSRIGQDSTTKGTSHIYVNPSTTKHRTSLCLRLSAQWTPNSTGTHSLSVFFNYLYTITLWFSGLWHVSMWWIQVSQRNMLTASSGSKWKGNKRPDLYRHVTLKVLNEIHRWTLKIWAACFFETTIKIFSAIKNCVVYLIILPVTQKKVSTDCMIGNKCGWNCLWIF
jgi:hypothetical protein